MPHDPPQQTTVKQPCAPAKPWRPEWDEEILRDWHKPTSISEFDRRFGINPVRVTQAAIRLGLWRQEKRNVE